MIRAPRRTHFHPSIRPRLESGEEAEHPSEGELCAESLEWGARLRRVVQAVLQQHKLDALTYPTWNNPPRLIGDLNTPHGNNSNRLAPPAGFPAITVPMGFVSGGLPGGIQFLGDAFSEATLIRIAYSYEQATQHRRPPPGFP